MRPGSCTVTITYANTGTVQLAGMWFVADKVPEGWSISVQEQVRAIAPGATTYVRLRISASTTAAIGEIAGRLTAEEDGYAVGGPAPDPGIPDPPPPTEPDPPVESDPIPEPEPVPPPNESIPDPPATHAGDD